MIADTPLGGPLRGLRRAALTIALVVGLICLAGALWRPAAVLPGYLAGFLYVLQLPLGCLGLLMIDHLVGGAWSASIRRALEAGAATFPWVAALCVPVLLAQGWLYAGTRQAAAMDPSLAAQALYFDPVFFSLRAVFYFAVWIGLSRALLRAGAAFEAEPAPARRDRLMGLAAGGLVAYGLVSSFALIDWGMAVEPRWFSTVYPMMVLTGGLLAALALGTVSMAVLAARGAPVGAVAPRTWQDLGNLMLTLLLSWAYLAFSQFLIIWSADLPSEVAWYRHRGAGGWGLVALALFVFHLLLPFAVLLSRQAKRRARVLAWVALGVLALHGLEALWLVWPSYPAPGWEAGWLGALAPVAPIGLWLWAYLGRFAARPVTPPPHASFGEVPAHG